MVAPPGRGSAGGEGDAVVVAWWVRDPRCVGEARSYLGAVLGGWGLVAVVEGAEVVLSELLGNAVRHGDEPWDRYIETRFERLAGAVRIEVHDTGEGRPVLRERSEWSESGRGLILVDAITEGQWGVGERQGPGKVVWAVVRAGGSGGEGGAA